MKKTLILIFVFVSFYSLSYAQETSLETKKEYNKNVFLQHKNTISFSPFDLALSKGIISYERKFGNKNSFVFQNAYQMYGNLKKNSERKSRAFKFNTEVQYRRYLSYFQLRKNKFPDTKNAFGVYVAPFVGYEYGEQHYRSVEDEYDGLGTFNYSADKFFNAVQGGLLAGINFDFLYGKISVQLNGGMAYKHSWVIHNKTHQSVYTYHKMKPGIMSYGTTGFIPKINFQIGYNF